MPVPRASVQSPMESFLVLNALRNNCFFKLKRDSSVLRFVFRKSSESLYERLIRMWREG